jgi:hypothetical protein
MPTVPTSLKASKDPECSPILCEYEIVLYKNTYEVSLFLNNEKPDFKKFVRLAFNIQMEDGAS